MRTALFFDFDDTLHDFEAAYRHGFGALARQVLVWAGARDIDAAQLKALCQDAWDAAWHRFVDGYISERELWIQRLTAVFAAVGLKPEPERLNRARELYIRQMEGALRLFPETKHALDLAAALHPRPVLGVLTNGVPSIQASRLTALGLYQRFDLVLISGAVGVSKPDPRFFDLALRRAGVSANQAVMVGDNATVDVLGALRAGLHAIWLNRHGRPWPVDGPPPCFTATDLLQAVEIARTLLACEQPQTEGATNR